MVVGVRMKQLEKMKRLERLSEELELKGVKKYGRIIAVAEKTGYTKSSVAKILAGHYHLSDKFINAVCEAFNMDAYWVRHGTTPLLGNHHFNKIIEDDTASSAMIELLKMSKPDQLRALAMLMEMNEDREKLNPDL